MVSASSRMMILKGGQGYPARVLALPTATWQGKGGLGGELLDPGRLIHQHQVGKGLREECHMYLQAQGVDAT